MIGGQSGVGGHEAAEAARTRRQMAVVLRPPSWAQNPFSMSRILVVLSECTSSNRSVSSEPYFA